MTAIYIYESPNGGNKLSRRRFGEIEKEILIDGKWHMMDKINALMHVLEQEIMLREKYPAVQAAWEYYQTLIELAKTGELGKDEDGQD